MTTTHDAWKERESAIDAGRECPVCGARVWIRRTIALQVPLWRCDRCGSEWFRSEDSDGKA